MKNFFRNSSIIVILGLTLFAIGCGSPIRPIYQVVAEEEAKAQIEERRQQLVNQKGGRLTPEIEEEIKQEIKKDPKVRKIQTETNQKIASYDVEINQIITELLKKKPSEMTQEEFQIYLLLEQKHIAEQHAKNTRKWQTFDVLFRTIPYALGGIVTIIVLIAD